MLIIVVVCRVCRDVLAHPSCQVVKYQKVEKLKVHKIGESRQKSEKVSEVRLAEPTLSSRAPMVIGVFTPNIHPTHHISLYKFQ